MVSGITSLNEDVISTLPLMAFVNLQNSTYLPIRTSLCIVNSMTTSKKDKKYYNSHQDARDTYTQAILNSDSDNVVIVAGPGTGKTYLFQQILEKRGSNSLTLSFINALVNDLAFDLCGMCDVKTLHGFALSLIGSSNPDIEIFPKLPRVIAQDILLLEGEENVDFKSVFCTLEPNEKLLAFYKSRKDYYGSYYGFDDVVWAAVKYLETYPDRTPTFDQLLVDEFQDFNEVEVKLIDLLAENSRILIAGDDDQSLYGSVKNADPVHIRKRHGEDFADYEPFPLPYCSRCPEVVVAAVNDLIQSAEEHGLLDGRASKSYDYFPSQEKDAVGDRYPKILFSQQYSNSIGSFIARELASIAIHEEESFSVLVILPGQLKKSLLPKIEKSLRKQGLRNVTSPDPSDQDEPTLYDGLSILLDDKDSNLGWRIVSEYVTDPDEFVELVNESAKNSAPDFKDIAGKELRKTVRRLRSSMNKIKNKNQIDPDDRDELLTLLGINPHEDAVAMLNTRLETDEYARGLSWREVRDTPVTITTIPGSKGLSADYVFIAGFEDSYFGKDSPQDQDIFNLLVALTRARKRAVLLSPPGDLPKLIGWIDEDRLDFDLRED